MNTNTPLHPALEELTLLTHWEGPSEIVHERGRLWYTVGGVIAISLAAYGIITGAWTFSVVCILCAGMYMFIKDHTPGTHMVSIFKEGFLYDDTFLRWEDIEGFWFVEARDGNVLHVIRAKGQIDYTALVPQADIQHVRLLLSQCSLELKERRESLLDFISRTCKL